jgi:hypothetical protein
MNRIVPFASVALLAASSSAFAIPISTVGSADTLVDWTSLSKSSDAAERGFIADYLGVSAQSLTYTHLSSGASSGESGAWQSVDGDSSLFAFNFGSVTPLYFLIKTGSGLGLPGETGTFTHFLFQNVGELSYGVLDLDLFSRTQGNIEIGMVSHVSTTGTTNVPEPATLTLFGAALAALGFARRRKQPV